MENRVRVCWYCEKWQPGGIQAVQVNLLQHMDLNKIHMDIVVSEDDTSLFDERLQGFGVNKIVTLKEKYRSPAKRVFANIFAFGKLVKNGNYDVVHLNVCHGVELIYGFWAWLYRIPVRIVHCRNNDIGAGGKSRPIKILCHKICKTVFRDCANVKLANSDLAAKWLFTKGDLKKNRVKILRNGINSGKYAFDSVIREEVRKKLGIEDKFVVGHVGHFNYQKNHEYLLAVFQEFIRKKPDSVLLLVGEGENRPLIETLARTLGIADNVIFYGVTNDVAAVMMAMDVFVFPSRFEGFGNVLIEAQATGLKCVASNTVIPRAVQITNHITWVDLDERYDVWAERIMEAASGYERKSHVQEVVNAGYDVSNMAGYLQNLYVGNQ